MIYTKTTPGFVMQRWDADNSRWISQEFVESDETTWEDEDGETLCPSEMEGDEPYLPIELEQPNCLKVSDEEKDAFYELLEAFVDEYTHDMDFSCMESICKEDLTEKLETLTFDELKAKVKEWYPELLEEYDTTEDEEEQRRRDEKNGLYPEHWDDCN